jgi:sugar O-acyltransferase (sialic acid O-acetyltransferase NeuD family)
LKPKIKKPVIIVGAGGHAKVIIEALLLSGVEIIGCTSLNDKIGILCQGIRVLGGDDVIFSYKPEDIMLANGIGSLPNQSTRWDLAVKMRARGFKFMSVKHPSIIISKNVKLEEGVQIMAGSIIQSGVIIGQDSIINSGSILDHDCLIGSQCHISPGVTLSGGVQIDNRTHIGTGTVVIQNVVVGSDTVIAAGSVIYQDIPNNITLIQRR